jgi:hypothetical protein
MLRIDGQAIWFFLPALTEIFIGGKPSEGVASLGEGVSHQEGVEVLFQVLMGLVIVCCDRGFLEGAMHALHLAIGPGMLGFGQPMGDGVCITDSCQDVFEGICILLPIRKPDAIIGELGVKCVRHRRNAMAQDLCRHRLDGLRVELGRRERRRAVEGDTPVSRACFGTHLGTSDVAGARRR